MQIRCASVLFGGYLFVGRLGENPRIRKPEPWSCRLVVQIRSAVAYVGGDSGKPYFTVSQSLTHDNDTEQNRYRKALCFSYDWPPWPIFLAQAY